MYDRSMADGASFDDRPPYRRATLLLSATVASLVLTLAAGYRTRLALADASAWVAHTDQVKLAITDAERALDHGDFVALRSHEAALRVLTADNPRQQQNVTLAETLTEHGARGELEGLFASMQAEEDRLKTERIERVTTERTRSSVAFVAGAVLTVLFGAGALALLRRQRQGLARQQALLQAIVESVDEGIIALEPSRKIVAINAVARAMWGGSSPQGQWPEDWRPVLQATFEDGTPMLPEQGPLARALRGESTERIVYHLAPADVWVSASARPIRDAEGRTIAAVTTLRDVTEQRAQAEKLRDQSLTDELTGLLNRRGFIALASARITEASRTRAPIALLYADLNGLKKINDGLGHEQGDRAIADAARVLRAVFRGGDIVARIGGDEFVALLPNLVPSAGDALLDRLATAVRVAAEDDRPYRLSMSSGLTFMNWEAEQTLDDLLAEADRLMYARKRQRAGQSAPFVRVVPPKE
jgi:diguanylate cyclase (GGDEF)-like protein